MISTRSFALGPDFNARQFAGYYFMRLVPYYRPRRVVAAAIARYIDFRYPAPKLDENPAERSRFKATQETLRRLGCASLDPVFTPEQLSEIRVYLADKPTVSGEPRLKANSAPPDVLRSGYPLAVLLECPHILETINRPDLLQLASDYLGCRPTISGIGLHWSFPSTTRCDVQHFHRDPDDWRFLKLFTYLTDVDEQSGPHEFVLTSHLTSGHLRSVPYSDAEVEKRYGRHNVLKVVGPAGTTFCADTWGIHKGGVPILRPRLLLQTQYSVLPIAKFKYAPEQIGMRPGVDRYTNRLLMA